MSGPGDRMQNAAFGVIMIVEVAIPRTRALAVA